MLTAARTGFAIAVVGTGVVLGALLGNAANPEMKPAPEPSWRDAVQQPYDASQYHSIEAERRLIPFGGFPAEPDAAVAGAWPDPYDTWEAEPLEALAEPDFGISDPGAHAYAGYDAYPSLTEAERAGADAQRTAEEAALAAAGASAAEPQGSIAALAANR